MVRIVPDPYHCLSLSVNGLTMPPTLKKLKGHIAFGLSVRP